MLKSLCIGRPFGIRTYVHWSFWLLLAFVALSSLGYGLRHAMGAVLLVVAVFGCIVLHELGHALMARRFGIRTHNIILYPIGGMARLERIPERPLQEFLVAIAGPLVNVVIAGTLVAILVLYPERKLIPEFAGTFLEQLEWTYLSLSEFAGVFFEQLAWINILLVAFNLLPAFPMDGGRILRSVLASRLQYLKATQIAASVGKYIAVFIALVALFSFQPLLLLLAAVVYFAGQQELWMVRQRYGTPILRMPPFVEVIDVTPTRRPY